LPDERRKFLAGVVTMMQAYLGIKLTDADAQYWMLKLNQYPEWKLIKADDFTPKFGKSLADICKFLDEMRMPEKPYSAREEMGSFAQITNTTGDDRRKKMAHECTAHVKKMMSFSWSEAEQIEAHRCELEFLFSMRTKYPHLDWTAGRSANV
jgi:hypothetical protein